jgi:dCTP deaminase
MVLTDREIEASMSLGQINIVPPPKATAFSSTSLDLTLSKLIRVWKPAPAKGVEQTVCPADDGYKYDEFVKQFTTLQEIPENGFVLSPGVFMLGWTVEDVQIPSHARLAARVEGKSSLARLGIGIHITAPTIHAGFNGNIQLEICNHGPLNVKLKFAMPVCQLIFEQTYGTPAKGYTGQFAGQQAGK